MKDTLGKEADVFLDSDDLTDLRSLLEHVKATEALILLQSNKVLTRPWVLLEAYTAIQNEVPIVAFNVKGRGYGKHFGTGFWIRIRLVGRQKVGMRRNHII